MEFKIRVMETIDTKEIKELDHQAFLKYRDIFWTDQYLLSRLELNPEGCFVCESGRRMAGFVFTRTWGRIGWLGTFAVSPVFQRHGVGKILLDRAIESLMEKKCSVIGLETRAEMANNVALYLKKGFRLARPTLVLTKDLEQAKANSSNLLELTDWRAIRKMSNSVWRGLDYSKDAEVNFRYGIETPVLLNARGLPGFALLRTGIVTETPTPGNLSVSALVLKTRDADKFAAAVDSIESYAVQNKYNKLILPVNEYHSGLIGRLLEKNYRLESTRFRMIQKGRYEGLKGIDCSGWVV